MIKMKRRMGCKGNTDFWIGSTTKFFVIKYGFERNVGQ